MCPDRQILSVYFDGELDSPWKEKMEAHLTVCPECRARLEAYGITRTRLLGKTALSGEEAARNRILEKMTYERPVLMRGFWRGSITLPLPAAAGFVLAALLGLLFVLRPQPSAPPQITGMGTEVLTAPVSGMEDLLEYLNQNGSSDVVVIQLPENATFKSAGEPMVIRAADYSKAGGRK